MLCNACAAIQEELELARNRPGATFEKTPHVSWNGRERRKSGNAEERRQRIAKLQQDWEAERTRAGTRKRMQGAAGKRNSLRKK